ncbi:proliferation-associated protein 1 [Malassezia pachydermatis]|uniref:Proliferation-associated protein 1 n=1 Tax=Malassezia pachydermatis TaxID=77020 RepID=A0A0M8MLZ0_9BASI|nr:proliferation-associated protein 1 [Malassezia pachydermatis]KOS15166.1 proliferation-associated protein 1 [Malassezia pachydermatis]
MTDAADNFDVTLTKYKTAGEIAAKAIRTVIDAAQEGKTVLELMQLGDEAVEQGTSAVYKDKKMAKGLAFPTTVSINNVVCNYAPLPSDDASKTALQAGDVVKFQLGAQIDGYAAVVGETVVVGASAEKPVTGRAADVLKAAHTAADVAIRLMRPGMLNHDIAKQVEQTVKEFDVRGVDGMQTNQFAKDEISGKKKIAFGGDGTSRPDACKLEENEVYGVDIVVTTSADGKSKSDDTFTSIYRKTNATYLLKMATSRKVFSEIQKKAGAFPFNLRALEDEKRARMGVQECANHGLVTPFQVLVDANASAITAQVFFTVAVNAKGAIRLTPAPTWYSAEKVQSDKEVQSEEIKSLLATSVRQTKKKNKKTAEASA